MGEVFALARRFIDLPSTDTSPDATVSLPSPHVDWEVELVVVIGRPARHVREADAWSYVDVMQPARTSELIVHVSPS